MKEELNCRLVEECGRLREQVAKMECPLSEDSDLPSAIRVQEELSAARSTIRLLRSEADSERRHREERRLSAVRCASPAS